MINKPQKNPSGKKICNCRRPTLIALGVFAMVAVAAVFLVLNAKPAGLPQAQADESKWKNFKEDRYGFSMDYPAGWSLDVSYDLYAKGLMNADLNNKKCGADKCGADCADIRILVGKKPSGQESQGLLTQLYEDFLMTKDFANASLVNALDFDSKKVFKISSEAPTLALNGACPGPLYVFDAQNGEFVYIFAGYGDNARENGEETVQKIISSINAR